MIPDKKKRAYRMEMLLAVALVATGLTMSGVSVVRLSAENKQMAQATPPLQSTPGAENKSSAPPEPTTGTVTRTTRRRAVRPGIASPSVGYRSFQRTPGWRPGHRAATHQTPRSFVPPDNRDASRGRAGRMVDRWA